MSDPAHKATDKEIERLEKKIKREYAKALDELEDKASAHFARFEEQDNRKRGELEMGYISKSEYYAWRQSQMAAGKRYETLIKDMAETLVNADKIAAGMIGERIPEVYAINSNYAAYEICEGTGANISFDLYDRNTAERLIDDPIFYPRVDIEKDERWNEKKVRSALLQGILQGDSVLKIANRLQQVTNMDDAAAVRNARTFCTRAQNAGRNDRYKEVEEKYGLHFDKEWISTDDNRTRDTHKDKSEGGVGGEVVGIDEEFSNKLQYPGDPAGAPSEVYNCRCTMRSIYRGKKKDAQEEFGKFDTDTTFEEWTEKKEAEKKQETPATLSNFDEYAEEWHEKQLEKIFERGIDPNIYNDTDQMLNDLIENNAFRMRIPAENTRIVEAIISEGRLKTQFETGWSAGEMDTKLREEASRGLFGYTEKISAPEYEKYGYLGSKNLIDDTGVYIGNYGEGIITLKKENMMDRTTMTIGDSLYKAPTEDNPGDCIASKVNNIDSIICQFDPVFAGRRTRDELAEKIEKHGIEKASQIAGDYFYYELQYHGTVSLEDIDSITLKKRQWEEIANKKELAEKLKKNEVKALYIEGRKVKEYEL